MKLIAQKPCSFGGKRFYIGDEIPVKDVLNPKDQAKMGVLAIVPDVAESPLPPDSDERRVDVETMTVVIRAEEGDMPLNLTAEGLQAVVDVLTRKVEDAEPIVAAMNDGDALILLHVIDIRKTIKEAAEARAQAINAEDDDQDGDKDPEESEGEQ